LSSQSSGKAGLRAPPTLFGWRVPAGRRHTVLRRRILLFNAFAFAVLIAGVLWIQATRVGLVDERIAGIREQALIVSGALAEYSADQDARAIKPAVAEPLLRQLIAPTRLRARVYSNNGRLVIDTRFLLSRNLVTVSELPPIDEGAGISDFFNRVWAFLETGYDRVMGLRPLSDLERYIEAGDNGRVYQEVVSALSGYTDSAVRVNEADKLVLSVAVPIQRFSTLYGVLLLTTESGDIDDILKAERVALIQVFIVAFVALFLSSLYLAGFIAEPVRQLAAAAERVRRGRHGREHIPTLEGRRDEIGELAENISAMTQALYDRIDAIESFAADVAHELKNPLTSLRSALDMFERVPDGPDRQKLAALIRNDLKRIDRLITEISDASRLDAELSRGHADPVDMGALLDTLVTGYRATELPRGVDVVLSLDLDRPAIVGGMDERLGQVFRNLVDNALSFSPDGGTIYVSAARTDGMVRVVIEDEGPGVAPENIEKVFDRFFTERPPEHGFGRNSGLGLAITKQIVERHGGRIRAENRMAGGPDAGDEEKIAGARFIVELPVTS
jgi:two-component system, OmpR family, sensor histidine kinase ChvG